jgi:outer membrane protein assembly factor BamB
MAVLSTRNLEQVPNCPGSIPTNLGISDAATVASVTITGQQQPSTVVFVGGETPTVPIPTVYALNAHTGAIFWQMPLLPLGTYLNNYIWSSLVFYDGSLYIGLASVGDCPLVQGQLFKLDAASGAIQASFDAVPNGCIGGVYGAVQ